MKKPEPNKQLGISTLGFFFAHIAHLRRFMHPETEHQALYSNSFGGGSRSVLWGGYLGISLAFLTRYNVVRDAHLPSTRPKRNVFFHVTRHKRDVFFSLHVTYNVSKYVIVT